jgi:HemY protein
MLESRLEAADWDGALGLVKGGLDRKIVPPVVVERARAALLAASAAQLEHAPEPKARAVAQDQAVEAARLQPGFAPGVVMAARLLALDNKLGRAAATLENAWRAGPHPALWLAYRDLRTDETPRERAQRIGQLAAVNPTHRESLFLYVEQALIAGDAPGAREAAKALEGEPVTARIAGLMARAAYAAGAIDEARMWLAQGMNAPPEPDWSDLDPEGRAFAYHAQDWARLVITYAETGELIHPRHERRERTLRELPELPLAYADAGPMLTEPVLYPVDEGYAEPEPPADETHPPRRNGERRRLSRTPRTAK